MFKKAREILPHTYAINEIFYSIQGEGFWAGSAAWFIRFAGCNLRCPFCDTDYSALYVMTAEEIKHSLGHPRGTICVITGGEPLLQIKEGDRLIAGLHDIGMRIHIETNGTQSIPSGIDWVTVSPKGSQVVFSGDEIKVIYQGQNLEQYKTEGFVHHYLQPCWGDSDSLAMAIAAVKENPLWRLSLQTHKFIGIA